MDIGSIGEANRLFMTSAPASGKQTVSSLQVKTETATPSTDALEAWDRVVQAMENNNTLQMNFDKELNRVIVQVINRNSQEVIIQIPSQEVLNIMRRLRQYLSLITDGRV
jgi:flagellar protein FlaG